jgi:phosphoribosyl 1,2-cyclic phosphate phosphodiesterase
MATLRFLGSGTSMGVPTLGCGCAVCTSTDPKNRRTRPSVLIEWDGHAVVIDTGPDFHAQALREGIKRLDAVLYTHSHADHILGMDDLRPLSFRNVEDLPLYADNPTADAIERVFHYTFRTENRFGVCFRRIPVTHGRQEITGYRFGGAAYLTDMSGIPEEGMALLEGLDVLILDALRREPHPSHSHLANSIAIVERLKPKKAFFTHIGHELDHAGTNAELPENIRLAYDGLKVEFQIAGGEQ